MKRSIVNGVIAMLHSIRVLMGGPGVCIFPFYTCQEFAQDQLRHQPLYKAVPAIIWRVLSCNPINAWWAARHNHSTPSGYLKNKE